MLKTALFLVKKKKLTVFNEFSDDRLNGFNHFTEWFVTWNGSWRKTHHFSSTDFIVYDDSGSLCSPYIITIILFFDDRNKVWIGNVKLNVHCWKLSVLKHLSIEQLVQLHYLFRKANFDQYLSFLDEGIFVFLNLQKINSEFNDIPFFFDIALFGISQLVYLAYGVHFGYVLLVWIRN